MITHLHCTYTCAPALHSCNALVTAIADLTDNLLVCMCIPSSAQLHCCINPHVCDNQMADDLTSTAHTPVHQHCTAAVHW
jgi:hypothetical protein